MRRATAFFPITLARRATSFVPPRRPQEGEVGPQPRESTESVGPAPRLRYLPLTDFWLDHASYGMVSIEKIMAARGLDAVRNPQARSWIAIARVLAKLRLPLNLWRTPLGPVFVTCVGTGESRTLPLACWTELIPYCFDCWAPEWSGNSENVETVAFRYFESFASRCVVVGHCPRELEDLFGYNPVVEIEPGRELEQILSVLEHIQDYEPIVERNYKRLLETSTWELRVEVILSYAQTLVPKA